MITTKETGEDNYVDVNKTATGEGSILVLGNVNRVLVGAGARLPKCTIEIRGNRCVIVIGPNCNINGILRCRADDAVIQIGEGTSMLGATITLHEAGAIKIGRDCALSGEIRMDCSDMHSVIDLATKRRINPPADIVLEDHVLLGFRAQVSKGTHIGSGTIVSANAAVSGRIPANCLVGGSPASVLREGVTWSRKLLPFDVDLPVD